MVVSLAKIGRCAYPQMYAVIRDTEGNYGLQPVPSMDGEGGQRVGYTVDVSVDLLGNTSHVDIHDGSQGYSVCGGDSSVAGVQTGFMFCPMFMAFVLILMAMAG